MASACRVTFAALIAVAGVASGAWMQAPPIQAPPSQAPAAVKPQPAPAPSAESVQKAEQVLADARKALGGDKLAEIKTIAATGRTKRIRGNNLVPIEFEILIEPPAKYVRIDEFPAEDMDPTSTGAGGTAPRHVQQFVREGHLRWDSLGEFMALAESFAHLSRTTSNKKAQILSDTLDRATGKLMQNRKSPGRVLGQLDNAEIGRAHV